MTSAADILDVLNENFIRDHVEDAARILKTFSANELVDVLPSLSNETIIKLWPHLTPALADSVLCRLPQASIKALLIALSPADCVQTLGRLRESEQNQCMALLPEVTVRDLRNLMIYPEGTAGRLMDPQILLFYPGDTVAHGLKAIKKQKSRKDRKLFLIDRDRHLLGSVDIQDLALGERTDQLQNIAKPPRSTVDAFATTEEVVEKLTRFKLEALPVLDINEQLIGVIRQPALLQALQEESLTGMQTMVGSSPDERALSSVWLVVRKRLPWMQINLATAFLAAFVVGLFETTIAQFTALAVLLPVVAGQSGNAGAQAQAVTMRGLALKEVTPRNWRRLVFKEARVGVVNGLAVALTTAAGVYLWSRSLGLSLVIGVSMILSMSIACMAGALVPLSLSKMGMDPAQSSSIVLTTVTDVAGFLSFLGIATLLSFML